MLLHAPSANPSSSAEEVWTTAFNEVGQRTRRYFARQDSHRRALAYVQGLMSSAERKNGHLDITCLTHVGSQRGQKNRLFRKLKDEQNMPKRCISCAMKRSARFQSTPDQQVPIFCAKCSSCVPAIAQLPEGYVDEES
jgi:hypothetical protein